MADPVSQRLLRRPRRAPATRRRTRSRRPTAGWPASCTPTSTRTRRRRSGSRRSPRPTRCSPTRRSARCTTSAATRSARGGGFGQGAGFGVRRHHGRVLRRRRRRSAARGRASAAGQDALIRLEIDLAEAAFGATREHPGRHRRRLPDLHRRRAPRRAPSPRTCDDLPGPRRGPAGAALVPRPGHDRRGRAPPARASARSSRDPCPECAGDGRVRTRRTLTVKIPPGVDTGTRIQLAGEGEVGPGGGPAGDLYVEIVERPHAVFQRQRRRPALHASPVPDDGGRARHHASTLETLDGPERGRRARRARSPARPSPLPRLGRHAPARRRAAATCSCTSTCRRRPGSTPSRRSCCASSPRCAARTAPRPARSRGPPAGPLLPAARRLQRALTPAPLDRIPGSGVSRPRAGEASGVSAPVLRARGADRRLVAGEAVVLDGPEGRHAATVRRLRRRRAPSCSPTARARRRAGAVAAAPARDAARGRGRPRSSTSRRRQPRLVVVQALPKGDRGELAVETMTEVGVDVIVPVGGRALRDPVARASAATRRWTAGARRRGEAAKQSRRSRFPEVRRPREHPRRGRPAARGRRWRCVLHEEAAAPLADARARRPSDVVVVVVGPEGGISPEELAAFAERRRRGVPARARRCCAPRPPGPPRWPSCWPVPGAGSDRRLPDGEVLGVDVDR